MTLGMGIAIAGMWASLAAVVLGYRRQIIDGDLLPGMLGLLAVAVVVTMAISGMH